MKRRIALALISGVIYSGLSFSAEPTKIDSKIIKCGSTKEYVTTVQFLRDQKDYGLDAPSIFKIADEVSKGCSGASQRFIKIATLLTRVGIDSKNALETAKRFSEKEDSYVEAFITIFKQTYQSNELDLDALNAMKISLKLSVEFDGTVKHAVSDFNKLSDFCKSRKEMDLPLPKCAELATEITRLGQGFDEPIAKPFINLVEFLEENKKGPERPKSDVIEIAKKVMVNGPMASENFIQAYRFGVAKDGLALGSKESIEFAIKMSNRSFKKI